MRAIQCLIIPLLISISLTAESQIFQRYGLSYGIALCSQDNYWAEDGGPFIFSKSGLSVFIHMEGDINHRFAYSSDFAYVQKGYIPDDKWNRNYELTLHYISYNPQIKYQYGDEQVVASVFTGPRMDYLVGSDFQPQLSTTPRPYENTVFGYNFGIDVTRCLQKIGFRIMIQYQGDFSSALPKYANEVHSYRNRALLMNLGFFIFLDGLEKDA